MRHLSVSRRFDESRTGSGFTSAYVMAVASIHRARFTHLLMRLSLSQECITVTSHLVSFFSREQENTMSSTSNMDNNDSGAGPNDGGNNDSTNNNPTSQDRIIQSIYDHMLRSIVVGYAGNVHELIKTGKISSSDLQTTMLRPEIFPSLYQGKSPEEIQSILDQYGTEIPMRQRHKKRKLSRATATSISTSVSTSVTTGAKGTVKENTEDNKPKNTQNSRDEQDNGDKDNDDDDDEDDEDYNEETKSGSIVVDERGKNSNKDGTSLSDPSLTVDQQLQQQQNAPGVDIWGRIPPKEPSYPVDCTVCGRQISSMRFAQHLEKCMGLSTRPLAGISNRSSSSNNSTGPLGSILSNRN